MQLQVTMSTGATMQSDEALEPDTWETSAEQFIADNDGDDDLAADVNALNVGDSFVIGGGAAPEFRIERLS